MEKGWHGIKVGGKKINLEAAAVTQEAEARLEGLGWGSEKRNEGKRKIREAFEDRIDKVTILENRLRWRRGSFPNSCLEQLSEGKFSKIRKAGWRRDQGKVMIHHLFDTLKFGCLWAKPNAHVKWAWSSRERPAGVQFRNDLPSTWNEWLMLRRLPWWYSG